MSDRPEKIWIFPDTRIFTSTPSEYGVEYIRADLAKPSEVELLKTAIDKIETIVANVPEMQKRLERQAGTIGSYRDKIKKLEAQLVKQAKPSEWISVDDRLPLDPRTIDGRHETVDVIVVTKNGDVFPCEFSCGNTASNWSKFDASCVTHWQPLPSKPE